jgi:hypothetical protein
MNIHITAAVPALILGLMSPAALAQSFTTPAGSLAGPAPVVEGRDGLPNSLKEQQHGLAPSRDDELTTGSVNAPHDISDGLNSSTPSRWRGIEKYWKGTDIPTKGERSEGPPTRAEQE